jgi:hypothetical protein
MRLPWMPLHSEFAARFSVFSALQRELRVIAIGYVFEHSATNTAVAEAKRIIQNSLPVDISHALSIKN